MALGGLGGRSVPERTASVMRSCTHGFAAKAVPVAVPRNSPWYVRLRASSRSQERLTDTQRSRRQDVSLMHLSGPAHARRQQLHRQGQLVESATTWSRELIQNGGDDAFGNAKAEAGLLIGNSRRRLPIPRDHAGARCMVSGWRVALGMNACAACALPTEGYGAQKDACDGETAQE